MKFHGNLKSSNCVIDSRWVCKLTDFGIEKLKTPLHIQSEEIGDHAAYARTYIQSNFDGSNIFGTIENCSRHGWFEPLRVNYGAKSGSKWR